MIKVIENNIEYTIGDSFSLMVYPQYDGAFTEGMSLKFVIAKNEYGTNIINKEIKISDELDFNITLTNSEISKLALGDYIYKMTTIKGSEKITEISGHFAVKWGA